MRSSILFGALTALSTVASSTPYQVTNFYSDVISGYKHYSFDLTYTSPAAHSINIPTSEPTFNTTHCKWDTDSAAEYVNCGDSSIKTIGDYSQGTNLKLTVVHSWTVSGAGASAAQPAKAAKEYTRTANKTVQAVVGLPTSFTITGGSEVPVVTRRKEGQQRRDAVVAE